MKDNVQIWLGMSILSSSHNPFRSSGEVHTTNNQLLRIEQLLGKNAVYAGLSALKKSK